MPPIGANPHDAVLPDFASDKHADACLALTDTGLLEDQAIAMLSRLWTLNNEKEKLQWDLLTAEEARAAEEVRQLTEMVEALLRQQDQADKEAALAEERKKHKNKFVPVPNTKVPLKPVALPAKYALKQMENRNYIELYYFTNQGIADAKEVAMAPSDGTYVWKQQEDGLSTIVDLAESKRGVKTDPLPDDKLSWEQFFEATPRMIKFMMQYNWPQDRINMHYQFWLNIQSHRWRTSNDPLAKKALLVYQAEQRQNWHYAIGTPFGYSIAEIKEEVLKRTRDELGQNMLNAAINRLNSVSPPLPPLLLQPSAHHELLSSLLANLPLDSIPIRCDHRTHTRSSMTACTLHCSDKHPHRTPRSNAPLHPTPLPAHQTPKTNDNGFNPRPPPKNTQQPQLLTRP